MNIVRLIIVQASLLAGILICAFMVTVAEEPVTIRLTQDQKYDLILKAVEKNELDHLKELVRSGIAVSSFAPARQSSLIRIAIENKFNEIFNYLTSLNLNLSQLPEKDKLFLAQLAVDHDFSIQQLRLLFQAGIPMTSFVQGPNTAKNIATLQKLLDAGIKVADFGFDIDQQFAITKSLVENNKLALLKKLVQQGIKITQMKVDQQVELILITLQNNYSDIFNFIISLGISPNVYSSRRTDLARFANASQFKVMNFSITDFSKKHAFELIKWIIVRNDLPYLQLLIHSGLPMPDLTQRFRWVLENVDIYLPYPFEDVKRTVFIKSYDFTLLHLAVIMGDIDMIKFLIENLNLAALIFVNSTLALWGQYFVIGPHWTGPEHYDYELEGVDDRTGAFTPVSLAYLWLKRNNPIFGGFWESVSQKPNIRATYEYLLKYTLTKGTKKQVDEIINSLPSLSLMEQSSYKTDTGIRSNDVNLLHIAIMEGNVAGVQAVLAKANEQERKQLLQAKADINFGDVPGGEPMTPKRLAERLKILVAPTKLTWGMAAYGKKLRNAGLNDEIFDEIIKFLEKAENANK